MKMIEFPVHGYPRTLMKRFSAVVIPHIEALPSDYYKMMREFTKNGNILPPGKVSICANTLGFDFAEDYKKILRPEELVQKYISLDATSLEDILSGYDKYETVGEIDGLPVLFLRASGQYYFECDDAGGVLSVALTGAFYPPVLPNKLT